MSFRGRPVPGRGGLLTPAAPTPPAFAPTDLTGCEGWYDASDPSTITLGLASAKPGDEIDPRIALNRWADKSPASRHLDNPGGAVTGTRTLNGKNALEFVPPVAGIASVGTYTRPVPLTMFLALSLDTVAASAWAWIIVHEGGSVSVATNTGKWTLYCGGGVVSGAAATAGPHVVCYQYSGATSAIWVDGTQVTTGDPGAPVNNTYPFRVGSFADCFDGVVGEHIRYSRALTAPERQQVEQYLKAKWATP